MLRLILESHHSIQCFDESKGYEFLVKEAKGGQFELPVRAGSILQGFKIPRFAEQLVQPIFSDPDYGIFPSFYKGEKVIHIIRDVLDVVGSMIKLKIGNQVSWLEKYGKFILRNMIERENLPSFYKIKYADIAVLGFPAHLVGALYWGIKNQGYFDLIEENNPVYLVKYESLVAAPEKELHAVCQYLEVQWSDSLLNHPAHGHGELDENGRAIGGTDPKRGIDMQSVGMHRFFLTDDQVNEIRLFAEDMPCQLLR